MMVIHAYPHTQHCLRPHRSRSEENSPKGSASSRLSTASPSTSPLNGTFYVGSVVASGGDFKNHETTTAMTATATTTTMRARRLVESREEYSAHWAPGSLERPDGKYKARGAIWAASCQPPPPPPPILSRTSGGINSAPSLQSISTSASCVSISSKLARLVV
ncbi:uncharacterized protein PHACADRAFT_210501 [Phanerochaete carnosa HHB-10118-sp]|uniref:Uncharacterized protein n=1 Tax=Phanerochaete carnosa (strain HHB-10118-sp) TaxID=650164 RepID=K5WW79_PHACS|nr:uncharacterized protein PHACADRAFT_210501 [Phanerochaete carnosa HHB-10118-sp]EKM54717.1 hypothetical protein PHACADRAFT_210501 [Phanerochaete carnosa HHB-10118-sp]